MMSGRHLRRLTFAALALLLVIGLAGPALASPAPVTACPPCGDGFERAAEQHGLDTDVRFGEATVRAHTNGSATWTVRVVPTNASSLAALAANRTLARAVAADSFGVRYGGGIDHELLSATVRDGAFVIRYRTLDVVESGPMGSLVMTYFRDAPGAWVHVGLGADELTVVAPSGMTVARGFGDVDRRTMTAVTLPDVRDGPFVVFAPAGHPVPVVLGTLAVLDALGAVILRNLVLFVALPSTVLVGGFAAIHRYVDPRWAPRPARLGSLLAVAGALLLAVTALVEGRGRLIVTGNLALGGTAGVVFVLLGVAVAAPSIRRRLSAPRLAAAAFGVAVAAVLVTEHAVGSGGVQRILSLGAGLLPAAVALGWADAVDGDRGHEFARKLLLGLAAAVPAGLLAIAPVRALGGSLFLLLPLLLTAAAVGAVLAAVPLYLLGSAGFLHDDG